LWLLKRKCCSLALSGRAAAAEAVRKSSSVVLTLLLFMLLRLPRLEIELCENEENRRSVLVGVASGVGNPDVTVVEDDLYEMLLLLSG
jgi:hypothetical protein